MQCMWFKFFRIRQTFLQHQPASATECQARWHHVGATESWHRCWMTANDAHQLPVGRTQFSVAGQTRSEGWRLHQSKKPTCLTDWVHCFVLKHNHALQLVRMCMLFQVTVCNPETSVYIVCVKWAVWSTLPTCVCICVCSALPSDG